MMRNGFLLAGLLAATLPLGGCFEEAVPRAEAAPNTDATARVRTAAEERVRALARDTGSLRFRAMQTHRQAVAGTYAVCGQATVSGGGVFIPFVSVVSTANGTLEVEQHVARTNVEATRVYVEMVGRCFDGGGPVARAGGGPAAQPTPPLPTGLSILDEVAPPPVAEAATAPAQPAGNGTLVMRQNGNLRASPNGGGDVLRVARAGSSLTIFGTAPGGWYQVGGAAPEGWVHGSLGTAQAGGLAQGAPVQSASVQ